MLNAIAEKLSTYHVVLEPDENTPEWWAGAPSVVRDDDGTFYLACRMREGNSPKGKRGYEVRILKSADGRNFEKVHSITREAANVPGFERPAIVKDPKTGSFKLYGCSGIEQGWSILKWDDVADPAGFDPATVRPVIVPEYPDDGFVHVKGYKDPFVLWSQGQWHMFVIGYDRVERTYHFVSDDGEQWEPAGDGKPVMENDGWHNFFTRPASVVPMALGYLFVYEGSNVEWRDPVYNIATGLAYTPDFDTFADLAWDEPLLKSTTPGDYHTWRYSHWMRVGDELYVYFEAARPNTTNEIRLGILPAMDVG
jgi:hypothetical protein